MKKKKTKEEKEQEKVQRELEQKAEEMYIDKILPIVSFDEDVGIGIMDDGTFCDCFSIVCKDLNSITEDQLTLDILTWEKLYKTYAGDLKIVSFSFPTDTKDQQSYVGYKIQVTENPILKHFLQQREKELEIVHRDYLSRESALFFFASSPAEYKKNYAAIHTLLAGSMTPMVRKMEKEKKKKLFFKMCNKNLNH